MKLLAAVISLSVTFTLASFTPSPNGSYPIEELRGPCGCEKGWNFMVHQYVNGACREKKIYCSLDVELEPGYLCGTCPKPCSTCEEDEDGNITMCRVSKENEKAITFKAKCTELQDFFADDGQFVYSDDHCGPCECADIGDLDSDGDGVCDKKDDCPNNADVAKDEGCGCEFMDSDGDGICDDMDFCPNDPNISVEDECGCDALDSDRDGTCDILDECPENPDKILGGYCGCQDQDSNNNGICDRDEDDNNGGDEDDDNGGDDDDDNGGNDDDDNGGDGDDDDDDNGDDDDDDNGDDDDDDNGDDDDDDNGDDDDDDNGGDDDDDNGGDDDDDNGGDDDDDNGGDDDDDNGGDDDDGECITACDANGKNSYEWIEAVQINEYKNNSGPDVDGYALYDSEKVKVGNGSTLSLWITPGHADDICGLGYGIFVDWNKDCDFDDPGEIVFNKRGSGEDGIDIKVPDTLGVGEYTLRFVINLGRIYDGCQQCIDGEVEDYIIEIVESSCGATYEGFDYDADDNIQDLRGGQNWASEWVEESLGEVSPRIIRGTIGYEGIEQLGYKMGALFQGKGSLVVNRRMSKPIFQEDDAVYYSFLYKGGSSVIFKPLINGQPLGFYIDSNGFVVIGSLRVFLTNPFESYLFFVKLDLNTGEDKIYLTINPDSDGSNAFTQEYNLDIDSDFEYVGFRFESKGSPTTAYVDEIRVGCDQEFVLPFEGVASVTSEKDQSKAMRIVPNPIAVGRPFLVEVNGSTVAATDYVIFDSTGSRRLEGSFDHGENKVTFGGLPSGTYFIEAHTASGIVRERLVIQKN